MTIFFIPKQWPVLEILWLKGCVSVFIIQPFFQGLDFGCKRDWLQAKNMKYEFVPKLLSEFAVSAAEFMFHCFVFGFADLKHKYTYATYIGPFHVRRNSPVSPLDLPARL